MLTSVTKRVQAAGEHEEVMCMRSALFCHAAANLLGKIGQLLGRVVQNGTRCSMWLHLPFKGHVMSFHRARGAEGKAPSMHQGRC